MADEKLSKNIASVLGPVLIVVTLSELLNYGIWSTSIPMVVYFNGMVLFSVGLAIARFHNRWRLDWTLTISIMGWLMMIGGFFRLFFPNAEQAPANWVTYAFVGVLCLFGVIMSVRAYR